MTGESFVVQVAVLAQTALIFVVGKERTFRECLRGRGSLADSQVARCLSAHAQCSLACSAEKESAVVALVVVVLVLGIVVVL